MKSKILQIEKVDIPSMFSVTEQYGKYKLKVGWARSIEIDIPFFLDEDVAKICAMIMDGTINKNLNSCSFSQKKDKEKVEKFGRIIKKKFGFSGRYRIGNNTPSVTFSSKSLSNFLYHCLDIHKSDEEARIPFWIWKSPVNVIKEYLRYAFAMEGSITDPSKGKAEIRFHSCDRSFLVQLSKLLEEKFSIKSSIYEYFVRGYGEKYYLLLTNKESISKFSKIGFALGSHQKRLEEVNNRFKNKAWEITLVTIPKVNKEKFHARDVHKFFPYLCRRSIHWRLTELVKRKYLKLSDNWYSLIDEGKNVINLLKNSVKITRVRTKPRQNEERILEYLMNGKNYISQIARDLQINVATVSQILQRFRRKNKVKLIKTDKFQRKIWELVGR